MRQVDPDSLSEVAVLDTPGYIVGWGCRGIEWWGAAIQSVADVFGIASRNTLNDGLHDVTGTEGRVGGIACKVISSSGRHHMRVRISPNLDQEWFIQEAFVEQHRIVIRQAGRRRRAGARGSASRNSCSTGGPVHSTEFGVMIHACGFHRVI